MQFTHEFQLEDETCVEVTFEGTYSYDPGRYYGKPEDCYPEEEEWEVSSHEYTAYLTEPQALELDDLINNFTTSDKCKELILEAYNASEPDY